MEALAVNSLQRFVTTDLAQHDAQRRHTDIRQWYTQFARRVAENVPAYRTFLSSHEIDPDSIGSTTDFGRLPLMTKAQYMRRYPLAERCWHGRLCMHGALAVSSGSTGEPLFWPRSVAHECDVAYRFEQVLGAFQADRVPTLAVVCFALGTWVGGIYTATCCRYLAMKGWPLTVVTPGNQKAEIWRVLTTVARDFGQVVLFGYPPFLKDVIDMAGEHGFRWSEVPVKLVFAGEVFTESWRDWIAGQAGIEDVAHATASLYGTADGGVLGNETPLSITIRRYFAAEPARCREFFGESRLPTLVQYDPMSRLFELHDRNSLVVSGDNGVPLVRYHIADRGGVVEFAHMLEYLARAGFDPVAALPPASRQRVLEMPFVFLFGRADFTVSFYGANIFPENVSVALEQTDIRHWVTGKFVLEVQRDAGQEPELTVAVELARGVRERPGMAERLATAIAETLATLNSEFSNYVPSRRQTPRVSLYEYGHPDYFPLGIKHRYSRP